MARKAQKKKLGRGLSVLLGDLEETEVPVSGGKAGGKTATSARGTAAKPFQTVPIDLIRPNSDQPRRDFNEKDLDELATSIRERGIIQPVVLRRDPSNAAHYQIVAGERRWRAAQRAGLHDLPAVVRDLDDQAVMEIALIENIQRIGLNPIEEATGYQQLLDRFGYTQQALSNIVGKSRPHLANMMRLLVLPNTVKKLIRDGELSAGHARALISASNPEELALLAVRKGLTVRQVEDLVRNSTSSTSDTDSNAKSRKKPQKDADTKQIEGDLSAALGMKVSIKHETSGNGELRIRYRTLDDLDKLLGQLGN